MLATGAPEASRFLYSKLGFDPAADFAPVSMIGTFPSIVITANSSPLVSVVKFIADARSRPGAVSWGSPGIGTPAHLAGELFRLMAGVKMTHVPYERINENLLNDLITGRIDVMFGAAGFLLPLVRAHQVRGLAGAFPPQRFPYGPELPTIANPRCTGYEYSSSYGLYVPAKTALQTVKTINDDIVVTLRKSAVKDGIASLAFWSRARVPTSLPRAKNSINAAMWKLLSEMGNIKAE